ncbi:lipocalin-like domain-containing protein [Desulfobotulus mexicanus]|uniref:Carotenoid 1,2-hydratase n=1 Tax=Desulfobotulus mexicanus TaxID=2586642 RepID=A0A5Q4VB00_9BACT|nr:lipocalin-like domain-containing protein [Desulfobotulus mexicanus]TYT74924.1 carotenoid 1,2-hydratase [Desulfobotulus mexicanus]
MKKFKVFLLVFFSLCIFPFFVSAGDFPRVDGPCGLVFPKDHGPHPDFRTEWWYYTGNLMTDTGRHFGYQLTFFRSRLGPPGRFTQPEKSSPWRTEEIWMAHGAVSDMEGRRHFHASRLMRPEPGMVSWGMEDSAFFIHMGEWKMNLGEKKQHLALVEHDFAFSFELEPEKPLILHGDGGYSLKGNAPERASCYYSFTRLKTRGSIILGEEKYGLEGLSWMDHEFSSEPLDPDAVGWDWFSIHLSDAYDLMFFQVRAKDGSALIYSGTLVDPEGKSVSIPMEDVALSVQSTWRSPESGAVYPVAWRLQLPSVDLDLYFETPLKDQEMRPQDSPGSVIYWEGSILVSGTRKGKALTGKGYAELTGYAGSMAGRL